MRRRGRHEHGQVIVIVAIAMAVMLIGTAFVIDAGFAWAETRTTQNAADAAARAGAVTLASKAAGNPAPAAGWEEAVRNAVFGSAASNRTTVERAEYTDWQGNQLGVFVGDGILPPTASGVYVVGKRTPGTYFARFAGITQWRILEEATAVSGPTAGCTETLDGCTTLPVTVPVTVFQCANNGKTQPINPPQAWTPGQLITIPLCGGNPGSVGWIDWTPTAGGTSELTDVILNPPDYPIPLPSWHYITETGDISAAQVEDALNTYAGQIVQIPMFDSTCNDTPTSIYVDGCPAGSVGGAGQNQWYHIKQFLQFRLKDVKGAFINGSNPTPCGIVNANECLQGSFVTIVEEGQVTAPCVPVDPTDCQNLNYGVQLIH